MYPTYAPVYDPTAVMGRRFGAWIVDFTIGAIIVFALFANFAEQRDFTTNARAVDFCDVQNNGSEFFCVPSEGTAIQIRWDDILIVSLVGLGYWILNDALLTGITGFSIGKGIVGLRVVRQTDGRLAGFGRSCARWAMWIADWVPFCVPVVGLATASSSSGHRRVGDMVAKTLVVDKSQVGTPPQVLGLTTGAPGFPSFPAAPGYPGGGYPGGGYPGGPGYPGPAGYPGAPAAPPWSGGPATPPPAPGQPPAWGTPTGAPGSLPPWAAPQPMPTPSSPPQPTTPPWGAPEGSGPVWAPPPVAPSPAPSPAPGLPAPGPGSVDPTLVQPAVGDQPPTRQLPAVDPPAVATGPGVDGPLWDDARDAYIQWDHDINRWVQWDERTREWHPL